MPMTVPTHPAAVVALKLWRPRWFDGVALVLGAAAPDLAYALDGSAPPHRCRPTGTAPPVPPDTPRQPPRAGTLVATRVAWSADPGSGGKLAREGD